MTKEEKIVSQLTLAKYANDVDATINLLENALNKLEQLGVEVRHEKLLEDVSNRITFLLEHNMNELVKKDVFDTYVTKLSPFKHSRSTEDLFTNGLLYADTCDYLLADDALAEVFLVKLTQGELVLNSNDVSLNCFVLLYQKYMANDDSSPLLPLFDEAVTYIENNLDKIVGFDEFKDFKIDDFSVHHEDLNFYNSVGPYPFLVTVSHITRQYAMHGYYQALCILVRNRTPIALSLTDHSITLEQLKNRTLLPWLGEMKENPSVECIALFSHLPNEKVEFRFNKLGPAVSELRAAGYRAAMPFLSYALEIT